MRLFKNTLLNKTVFPFVLTMLVGVFGCTDPEQKAENLYEIAVFEEQQFNREHAAALYEEVVQKYPETRTAARARENLKKIREANKNLPPTDTAAR